MKRFLTHPELQSHSTVGHFGQGFALLHLGFELLFKGRGNDAFDRAPYHFILKAGEEPRAPYFKFVKLGLLHPDPAPCLLKFHLLKFVSEALKASCPAREALDFPGQMPLDDTRLARLYRGATALCLVSWYETFGFPWVEAMAYDCPVISTTAGAGPEIVAEAGLLCDPADPGAIAGAMTRIASDPALGRQLIEKGRRRVRRFSVTAMAEGTLEVYREVPGGKG